MLLKEKNFHPNDQRIRFDEENHIYYIDGFQYDISVTGFIKSFFQEFDADSVIKKNYARWQSNKNSKYYGFSIEEIKNIWRKNADEASYKGSILHKDIEAFYNGIDFNNESIEFKFFLSLNERLRNKYEPYRTEWTIFDEKSQLAGSVDMCYVDDSNNLHLFDWKRSKQISKENQFRKGRYPLNHIDDSNYWHYALQLNIYKYILQRNYGKSVSSMYLVRLHSDQQDYEVITIPDLTSEVELMLEKRIKSL